MSASRDPGDHRWPSSVYSQGDEPDPRFSFANERTFLAWIRTGLGFLAAGVAIAAVARLSSHIGIEVRIASIILVLCGMLCGIGALQRWIVNERALRLGRMLPSTLLVPMVTGVVVAVALIAFLVVGFG